MLLERWPLRVNALIRYVLTHSPVSHHPSGSQTFWDCRIVNFWTSKSDANVRMVVWVTIQRHLSVVNRLPTSLTKLISEIKLPIGRNTTNQRLITRWKRNSKPEGSCRLRASSTADCLSLLDVWQLVEHGHPKASTHHFFATLWIAWKKNRDLSRRIYKVTWSCSNCTKETVYLCISRNSNYFTSLWFCMAVLACLNIFIRIWSDIVCSDDNRMRRNN